MAHQQQQYRQLSLLSLLLLLTLSVLLVPSSQCLSNNHNFPSQKKRGFASFSSSSRRKFTNDAATFAAVITTAATTTTTSAAVANTNMSDDAKGDKIVQWGIVGLGDVTTVKSGPPFWKNHNSKLVAVTRRTPNAAKQWIETHVPNPLQSSITPYDDLDAFLQHENLDAVYVATPPESHLDVCRKVAMAGKICYVEKPVGRCGWETEEIIKAFGGGSHQQQHQQQEKLFTAYISRAYKRTDALKMLLQQKTIGDKVTSITYRLKGKGGARGMDGDDVPWRLNARKSGGGLIMDVGCHVIDRLDYLFGPLVDVKGDAKRRQKASSTTEQSKLVAEVEDYVSMTATIGSCDWAVIDSVGASVNCIWDFCPDDDKDDGPLDELTISGPKGSIQMAGKSPFLPISVLDVNGNVVKTLNFEQPEHTAQNLIQLVTDEIRGAKNDEDGTYISAPSRGENALRTSKVLDTVLSGYYGGREDKFWDRPETWPGRQQ